MNIFKEFKEFAIRGNVLDITVGMVVGTAFTKISSSLVGDILMPPLGLLLGEINLANYKWVLKPTVSDNTGKVVKDMVSINYGMFIQNIIDFMIVTFAIFLVIKAINTLKRKHAEKQENQAAPSQEVILLTQIRDLLEKKQ